MIKKVINPNRIVLILVLMLGFIASTHAQKNQISNEGMTPINRDVNGNFISEKAIFKNNLKEIEGTYQIQVSKSGYTVPLSESLYDKIQSQRKENEDVYLILDENSKLFLPARIKIKSVGFTKLDPIKVIIK